jgi:hypothetical protein
MVRAKKIVCFNQPAASHILRTVLEKQGHAYTEIGYQLGYQVTNFHHFYW